MTNQKSNNLRYYSEISKIHSGLSLTYAIEAGHILKALREASSEEEWAKILNEYKIGFDKAEELISLSIHQEEIMAQLGKKDFTIEKGLKLVDDLRRILFSERSKELSEVRDKKEIGKLINLRDINLN